MESTEDRHALRREGDLGIGMQVALGVSGTSAACASEGEQFRD